MKKQSNFVIMIRFLLLCQIVIMTSAFQQKMIRFQSSFTLQASVVDSSKSTFKNSVTSLQSEIEKQTLKEKLYLLSAKTSRGTRATSREKDIANSFADKLEYLNPTEKAASNAEGTWDLIYSNTNLFRASPLFMSARALAKGDQSITFNEISDRFINSLKFARIGRVTQIISSTSISSEIETEIPIFPGSVTGTIVSMAEIESVTDDNMTLLADNIRIKEGTSNIPLFGEFLSNFTGVSVKSLSSLVPSFESPKPVFSITYVDQDLLIKRDQDFNVFVFTKVNN